MTDVVISPHLDDAVLSCAGRLLEADVMVVTVCAGAPAAGSALSAWDIEGGAVDARERALARLAEDDAALAVLGAPTVRLDELGQHYRGAPYDVERVADRLVPLLTGAGSVWIPAGIGGHGAHVGTREAGLLAAVRAGVARAMLYADLPYAFASGWPSDIGGLLGELMNVGVDPARLVAAPRRLTPAEQRQKQAAVACYRSQLAQLGVDRSGRFATAEADAWELAWKVAT